MIIFITIIITIIIIIIIITIVIIIIITLYTWSHDSILNFLALSFQSVRDSTIFAGLPRFTNPSTITGDNFRPDLLLALPNKCLYILELAEGFELAFLIIFLINGFLNVGCMYTSITNKLI